MYTNSWWHNPKNQLILILHQPGFEFSTILGLFSSEFEGNMATNRDEKLNHYLSAFLSFGRVITNEQDYTEPDIYQGRVCVEILNKLKLAGLGYFVHCI